MSLPRLKLTSSHGDQTFNRMRFAAHGAFDDRDANTILSAGLRFVEGRPAVSSNLAHVFEWPRLADGATAPTTAATGVGAGSEIFVFAPPAQFHLGCGVFTTAYIDRAMHRVVGAPARYMDARSHLAFYLEREVETARERIEAEVAEGYGLDQRPSFVIEPKNIVGYFEAAPGFKSLIGRLEVSAQAFQPIDLDALNSSVATYFRPMEETAQVLVNSIVNDLLTSAVESATLAQLRLMRWQGLKLLGYEFFEDDQPVTIEGSIGVQQHLHRIDNIQKNLELPQLFMGQLAWLRDFAATQLRIMRVELDESPQMQ